MKIPSAALPLALVLFGCGPGPDPHPAKFWTTRDFLDKQGQGLDFGGWTADDLLVPKGKSLRFQEGTQSGGPGLTLFPAVADGEVAAFAITEIWANYPQPWAQPVWVPRDSGGAAIDGVSNVFPVDVRSTFYSPFWKLEYLLTNNLQADTYLSARDVLASKAEFRPGPLVLCPLIPEETTFADDGSGAKEPMSLRPVTDVGERLPKHLPAKVNKAWVDGSEVFYFDFGPHRAPINGQNLLEAQAYFFVAALGKAPLPLAAVLPADPLQHGLVRRVDVLLPPGATPFVPANRPELKRLLKKHEFDVELAPDTLNGFPEFTLRVAAKPSCFTDGTFPGGCEWLDTPEALEALPVSTRIVQRVQLAIGVVIP